MTFMNNSEVMRLMADCITHHQPLSDLEIVINTGINLDLAVHKGLRPLHYAVYENSYHVVRLLLEKGALVNIADDCGYTPLHLAAKNGYMRVLKLLIQNGAVVNFLGEILTGSEAKDSYIKDSCTLAELAVSPLNLALDNNHHACGKILLENGANPNQKYFVGHELNLVPLENIQCIELLLQHGADPDVYNRCGMTLLMKAAKMAAKDIIRLLISYAVDLDKQCSGKLDPKRAIHFSILNGDLEVVQMLCEGGASLAKYPEYPTPPLEYALSLDKLEICRMLLAFGADPNELNHDFCSPLQMVCSCPELKNQRAMLELLLEHGADPNYSRETHSFISPSLTPVVEYLAYNRAYDPEIFRLLFKHGAEVNMVRPTRKFTILDKCGILSQVRKLRHDQATLDLILEVCGSFNKDDIDFDRTGLPERHREIILHEAQLPRSLAHLTRLKIRRLLAPPKLVKIQGLPLPVYFKRFLTYDFNQVS